MSRSTLKRAALAALVLAPSLAHAQSAQDSILQMAELASGPFPAFVSAADPAKSIYTVENQIAHGQVPTWLARQAGTLAGRAYSGQVKQDWVADGYMIEATIHPGDHVIGSPAPSCSPVMVGITTPADTPIPPLLLDLCPVKSVGGFMAASVRNGRTGKVYLQDNGLVIGAMAGFTPKNPSAAAPPSGGYEMPIPLPPRPASPVPAAPALVPITAKPPVAAPTVSPAPVSAPSAPVQSVPPVVPPSPAPAPAAGPKMSL